MSDPITKMHLLLGLSGAMLFAASLHYRQTGKEIEYGWGGFTKNLSVKGKALAYAGMILVLLALFL